LRIFSAIKRFCSSDGPSTNPPLESLLKTRLDATLGRLPKTAAHNPSGHDWLVLRASVSNNKWPDESPVTFLRTHQQRRIEELAGVTYTKLTALLILPASADRVQYRHWSPAKTIVGHTSGLIHIPAQLTEEGLWGKACGEPCGKGPVVYCSTELFEQPWRPSLFAIDTELAIDIDKS
jgi:hypothetical protein